MKIAEIEPEMPKSDKNKQSGNKYYEKQKEKNRAHIVSFWFKYPGDKEFVERIRNQVKARNKMLDMRYRRMIKIANSESEASAMVVALGKEKQDADRKYRVWLRQTRRREKEQNDREFRDTVKTICHAYKNGKPA